MTRRLLPLLAVGLAVCILLLSGLVYPQAVAHAAHHAHHKAATHATALCTWMCAAGQGLEAIQIVLHAHIQPVTYVDAAPSEDPRGKVPLPSHLAPHPFPPSSAIQ